MSKIDLFKTAWLDVVFEGRNKAYGAYELRKENARTTTKSLLIASGIFVLAVSSPLIIKYLSGFIPEDTEKFQQTEVELMAPPPIDETQPPPPPPTEPPPPKVDQIKFPPPVVKPDEQVVEEEPPTVEELKVADPGQENIKGDPNAEVVINEPVGEGPIDSKVTEDTNEIFTSVEQLPEPEGGMDAFFKYLSRGIRYPAMAKENNIQGRVSVQFVVEKDGSLTNIKAINELGGGLTDEAVRVVKAAKKWKPGMQNGRPVRVQYTVPILFRLEGQ